MYMFIFIFNVYDISDEFVTSDSLKGAIGREDFNDNNIDNKIDNNISQGVITYIQLLPFTRSCM